MSPDRLSTTTSRIQVSLDRIARRDDVTAARSELLERAQRRIREIVRREASARQYLLRWEEEEDLLQEVLLRIHRAVDDARPEHVGQFFIIVGQHARWAAISMIRRHFGPEGVGSNHHTGTVVMRAPGGKGRAEPGAALDSLRMHEAVDQLPDEEREAWLLFAYAGLTHQQIADELGVVTKTIQRRLNRARILLSEQLADEGKA